MKDWVEIMQYHTKTFWQQFKKDKVAVLSAILFGFILLLTIAVPFIANDKPVIMSYQQKLYFPMIHVYSEQEFGGILPTETNYQDPIIQQEILAKGWMIFPLIPYAAHTPNLNLDQPVPSAPNSENWLGTDNQGRDVLARLLYGLRLSLFFAIALTCVATIIGIMIGAIQGYFAGWIDLIGQRLIEIWLGLPQLFIVMIFVSLFKPSMTILFLIMLLFSWSMIASLVRTEFLRLRQFDYVRAAMVLGLSHRQIIVRHILPNALSSTLSQLPFILTAHITALTALDFLGYGLPIGTASLGELLQQAKNHLDAPWLMWSVCLTLVLLLIVLVYLGESIRNCIDKQRTDL